MTYARRGRVGKKKKRLLVCPFVAQRDMERGSYFGRQMGCMDLEPPLLLFRKGSNSSKAARKRISWSLVNALANKLFPLFPKLAKP
ncbi:hypothetical protein VNO78_17373 [Psophocarpus tetragonolobus]|uniref:Uncharacterized protein n=1 Tax=Psophocarpus tetragonolobus TaxID=3891 RepID=A0AAN9SGS5_PSOTE